MGVSLVIFFFWLRHRFLDIVFEMIQSKVIESAEYKGITAQSIS